MEERDIILLTDEEGDQVEAEVLDYFFADGQEYAILALLEDEEHEHSCEDPDCDDCGEVEKDVFIMKVITHEDDTEEFTSVDEEEAIALYNMYQQSIFDEDEEDEDDDEDDEDEDEDGEKE